MFFMGGGTGPPTDPNKPVKLGFSTFAMWGLCFVVVGVCYALEKQEEAKPKALSPDVQRVLPSGAMLMMDGSTRAPPKAGPS
jgi:hypothetical protein